jgi:hypothetical protein
MSARDPLGERDLQRLAVAREILHRERRATLDEMAEVACQARRSAAEVRVQVRSAMSRIAASRRLLADGRGP